MVEVTGAMLVYFGQSQGVLSVETEETEGSKRGSGDSGDTHQTSTPKQRLEQQGRQLAKLSQVITSLGQGPEEVFKVLQLLAVRVDQAQVQVAGSR
jgi:hypothetical protein